MALYRINIMVLISELPHARAGLEWERAGVSIIKCIFYAHFGTSALIIVSNMHRTVSPGQLKKRLEKFFFIEFDFKSICTATGDGVGRKKEN
jgi:hypothetical protein